MRREHREPDPCQIDPNPRRQGESKTGAISTLNASSQLVIHIRTTFHQIQGVCHSREAPLIHSLDALGETVHRLSKSALLTHDHFSPSRPASHLITWGQAPTASLSTRAHLVSSRSDDSFLAPSLAFFSLQRGCIESVWLVATHQLRLASACGPRKTPTHTCLLLGSTFLTSHTLVSTSRLQHHDVVSVASHRREFCFLTFFFSIAQVLRGAEGAPRFESSSVRRANFV